MIKRAPRGRRLFGLMLAAAVAAACTPATLAQSMQQRIDQLLSDPALRSSRMGVCVLDGRTGRVIAGKRSNEQFIPASNMKLITSGVALQRLGTDFAFRTEILVDDSFSDSDGRRGRVVIRGGGDPGLADPKLLDAMGMTAGDLIDSWVSAVREAGLTEVAEVVVDDRVFDRQWVHPTWPVQQLNRWYCAEVAGLNFHTNVLTIFTDPAGAGEPPMIRTEPDAPWLHVRNRAKSVSRGDHTVWAARTLEANQITLHGDVRWATDPVDVALHDNATFTGRLLQTALNGEGIEAHAVRVAGENEDLSAGRVVHLVKTDMATAMARCNVKSYNLYAECFMKRLGYEMTGQPGSWSSGAALMRMALLEAVGSSAGQSLIVADGSGMSRENRVTPMLLAEWLQSLKDDEAVFDDFLRSLPSATLAEGTLSKRFRNVALDNEVRAKTGYLTGVSAISGYVIGPDAETVAIFSIITNEKPNSVRLGLIRDIEEKIVELADDWVSARSGAITQGG